MIRRIVVIGSIGLALAGGARFALSELAERRWEARKQELRALALFPPEVRRPWELRFEALVARLGTSERFDEIVQSPYRPHVALGSGTPRPLNAFEQIWLESLWNEIAGLEPLLVELRKLPLDALAWGGSATKLMTLRELTNALCGRAWLALERDDDDAAAEAYGDALRLARATDDGSSIGVMLHVTSDAIVLRSVRSALAFGGSPRTLRARLAPYLAHWGDVAELSERAIRRDLVAVTSSEGTPDDPVDALREVGAVEGALALARGPAEQVLRAREGDAPRVAWTSVASCLHGMHAQLGVALTALAVAEFREEHGAFPTTLAEIETLPREHALDPLTGAPLPYSFSGAEARVGPAAWSAQNTSPDPADSLYAWTLR